MVRVCSSHIVLYSRWLPLSLNVYVSFLSSIYVFKHTSFICTLVFKLLQKGSLIVWPADHFVKDSINFLLYHTYHTILLIRIILCICWCKRKCSFWFCLPPYPFHSFLSPSFQYISHCSDFWSAFFCKEGKSCIRQHPLPMLCR